jgi:protein disulfide-isomerase
MKNVKMGRFYAMMLAAVVCVGCSEAVSEPAERNAAAAASAWTEDIEGAFKTAAAAKKPVFINFTGSDWCYWCKIADKNIFQSKEWAAFSKKVVCLKVDFPRHGAPDVMTMKKRRDFAEKFSVRGYPTFVLVDAEKKESARFMAGKKDAATFIGEVEAALKDVSR